MFRLMTNSSSRLSGILSPTGRSSHLSLRMGNHLFRSARCCCCLDSRRFHPGLSGSDNLRMLSVENMILSVPAEHERPYRCPDKLLKHGPELRTKFHLALPPRRLALRSFVLGFRNSTKAPIYRPHPSEYAQTKCKTHPTLSPHSDLGFPSPVGSPAASLLSYHQPSVPKAVSQAG